MITLYSKPNCPYCVSAKTWLEARDFQFQEVNVLENDSALNFIKGHGHKTVPQIYIGDTLLVEGGFTGLRSLGEENLRSKLRAILAAKA